MYFTIACSQSIIPQQCCTVLHSCYPTKGYLLEVVLHSPIHSQIHWLIHCPNHWWNYRLWFLKKCVRKWSSLYIPFVGAGIDKHHKVDDPEWAGLTLCKIFCYIYLLVTQTAPGYKASALHAMGIRINYQDQGHKHQHVIIDWMCDISFPSLWHRDALVPGTCQTFRLYVVVVILCETCYILL